VLHNLLERLLLPPLEDLVVQELLRILVLGCNVDNQSGVDHYGSQNQHPRVFLHEGIVGWQIQSLRPVLVGEI
jgi:hypothetical protein